MNWYFDTDMVYNLYLSGRGNGKEYALKEYRRKHGMYLIDFLKELKHKNLEIYLFVDDNFIYVGTLGTYLHWIKRNKYDLLKISSVCPTRPDSINIYLIGE